MDIVDIYLECGNFQEAVRRSGLPAYVAHIKLIGSGVLKLQDKIKYGNKSNMLGAKAEELFQKYVPTAIDANRLYRTNNPGFDFEYKGLTIDVKYSSLRRKSKSPHRQWSVRCKGDRDFIVAFLEREPNSELNEPMILIIPYGMLSFEAEDTLHFFESSEIFKTYQVLPEQLVEILEDYASLKEQGLI
jgi:hypothetical protein